MESLILQPSSYVDRLDLGSVFQRDQPLEVELGSGDGGFLSSRAQAHPHLNFLGVERLLGRLRKLDRKALRAGLGNVRLLRIEAFYFLRYLMPPSSIASLHVYFPDPWPKRKHRKNRLINESFVSSTALALKPGGAVYVRTDDPDYFEQITCVFGLDPRFTAIPTPLDLQQILTDFEQEFLARGVVILRAAWTLGRCPGSMGSARDT